jgi:hypothetical protein
VKNFPGISCGGGFSFANAETHGQTVQSACRVWNLSDSPDNSHTYPWVSTCLQEIKIDMPPTTKRISRCMQHGCI